MPRAESTARTVRDVAISTMSLVRIGSGDSQRRPGVKTPNQRHPCRTSPKTIAKLLENVVFARAITRLDLRSRRFSYITVGRPPSAGQMSVNHTHAELAPRPRIQESLSND